ncbi:hypothetical protein QYE76_004917 [Lolium multiflorum]|uniref:Uncharacterized protein n=1 Tax=Lolium multiflorum TaxID=4521 RepID=A0AAD8W0N9_LOLMU|nr:hypothetical protein QYE76_004917 [Lolium multiflorum]
MLARQRPWIRVGPARDSLPLHTHARAPALSFPARRRRQRHAAHARSPAAASTSPTAARRSPPPPATRRPPAASPPLLLPTARDLPRRFPRRPPPPPPRASPAASPPAAPRASARPPPRASSPAAVAPPPLPLPGRGRCCSLVRPSPVAAAPPSLSLSGPCDKETMSLHLIKSGFKPSYKIWTFHGEKAKKRARKEVRQIQPTREYDTGFDRCLENLANGNVPESPHVEAETSRDAETSEEPEENTKKYYEALFASQKPLHVNTDVTQLDAIARLLAFKCHRNLCRDGFDELLVLVGSILPKGHLLPQNFYYSKKLLSDLKMSSQQIHACPKGCMLFREEHANTNYCIHCNSSRYFEVDTNGDGQKRQTTVAKNILRYLPVLPRIQRLFMTEDTAQQMRWAVEGIRPDSGKMIHPSDGTAWKNFVKKYPLKAGDPRSVAIAISTDGFNPYGPKYPGKNMNVYLEPLIDDLILGWEDRGIRTYDAANKEHFDMYVWYHTSLHDLPARALFCGWCTHGKWPCPECRQAVTFFWLNKGGKYSCFDEARQFLEQSHEYRSDVKSFKKGRVVHAPKPIPKTGQETKAELDAL